MLTVASIGLAQLLGGLEAIGSSAIKFVSFTGAFKVPLGLSVDLGVKTLGGDEMLIVLVAPVVLLGLGWFLLRTETGTAVRAAAENDEPRAAARHPRPAQHHHRVDARRAVSPR